jgi:hypothetical protein
MCRRRVELAGSYPAAVARRAFWAGRLRAAKRAGTHGARIRVVRLPGVAETLFGIYIEPHDDGGHPGEA